MQEFFRKLFYYRDLGLLSRILADVVLVGFTPPGKRLALAGVELARRGKYPAEKFKRYLTFVYFLMGRLWIRPRCLTSSVAVCRLFRKNGIRANIVFGCSFDRDKLTGHCWVETDQRAHPEKFRAVFSYPEAFSDIDRRSYDI
ncbi:MAG: lasso peptide biosynthesis B2 protein [Candidatus Omnitrophica bacterium]|nr:lasso peptide biosynthesis B2 protein [Candidatus Omnitrophota bacterium]